MSPLAAFLSAPPISRTIALTALIFSVLLYLNLLPFHYFTLSLDELMVVPPEIWRLVTSLFITGGGLGIVFDTYFLYVFGAKLEISSPRFTQRADFVTYILFCCVVILTLNLLVTSGSVLASALSLAFITPATIDTWNQPLTLWFIPMPSQYLPYALLFLTLICAGPQAMFTQATGLIAAHIYDILTGRYPASGISGNWIKTPAWVKAITGVQYMVERPYGMANDTRAVPKASWGLGGLGWKRFGEGRTLGEEGGRESGRPTGAVMAGVVCGGFLVVCGGLGLLWWRGSLEGVWGGLLAFLKAPFGGKKEGGAVTGV